MNIYLNQGQQNNIYNSQNFGSRSQSLKKADDICRRVQQEFPVLSNTRLTGFSTIKSTTQNENYMYYARDVVCKYREYYDKNNSNMRHKLLKEISGMKNLRTGNCAELSDAAYIALKLNGVDDVKRIHLYAYDKETQNMRDLDHSVIGINFKLPKNYKYNDWSNPDKYVPPECRIYPQNDSIIVDAWAGFSEYGKNAESIYTTNKALIEANKKWPSYSDTLLRDGEELCYVPLSDSYNLKKNDYKYYGQKYPNLIIDKTKSVCRDNKIQKILKFICPFIENSDKDISQKRAFRFFEISPEIKDSIKFKHSLKGAPTEEEMNIKTQNYIKSVNEKYGIKTE